jgi:hypothetical protein
MNVLGARRMIELLTGERAVFRSGKNKRPDKHRGVCLTAAASAGWFLHSRLVSSLAIDLPQSITFEAQEVEHSMVRPIDPLLDWNLLPVAALVDDLLVAHH